MLLRKEFTFDAAHNLVEYHGKCERLHGHTYRLAVVLEGYTDKEGMILDFVVLKTIVKDKVLSKMDHAYLNEIVPQPSAENLARWIFEQLDPLLKGENYSLFEVQVWETADSSCVFNRSDL